VNPSTTIAPPRLAADKPEGLREIWLFLVVMGVALIAAGAVAISSSFIASMATILVFGIMLVLGALFELVTALWGRSWRGFFLHLLGGVLYLIVGVFLIENPLESAVALTLLVAVGLLASGILRIVVSVVERFDGWGWMLLSGLIGALLGIALWRHWPFDGTRFIGLYVGIEMLTSGLSWLMLGMAVRLTPREARPN
jgi:uncharacterized membrane protein HdeD (DUF308 family)